MSMFQAAGHLKLMGRKLTQPMAVPPEVKIFFSLEPGRGFFHLD